MITEQNNKLISYIGVFSKGWGLLVFDDGIMMFSNLLKKLQW